MTLSTGQRKADFESVQQKILSSSAAERAYAAGLFDGEGCVAIYDKAIKAKNWHQFTFSMRIANTDPRPLEWLVKKFGGSITKRAGARLREGRRECYTWYIMNSKAKLFVLAILEYTIVKRQQLEMGLELYKTAGIRDEDGRTPDYIKLIRADGIAKIGDMKRSSIPLSGIH